MSMEIGECMDCGKPIHAAIARLVPCEDCLRADGLDAIGNPLGTCQPMMPPAAVCSECGDARGGCPECAF